MNISKAFAIFSVGNNLSFFHYYIPLRLGIRFHVFIFVAVPEEFFFTFGPPYWNNLQTNLFDP